MGSELRVEGWGGVCLVATLEDGDCFEVESLGKEVDEV